MDEKNAKATIIFSRIKDKEETNMDIMDISILLQGTDTQEETAELLVNGVMAGLSSSLMVEMGAETFDQMDFDLFKSGWQAFLKGLQGHFKAYKCIDDLAEAEDWCEQDEFEGLDTSTLLLAPGCAPELEYDVFVLWSDTNTKMAFDMPLDAKASALSLKGTRVGITESLVFLWFYVLAEELAIFHEDELFSLASKLVKTELNQVEGRFRNDNYLESIMRPWMKELKKLDTRDKDASTQIVVD